MDGKAPKYLPPQFQPHSPEDRALALSGALEMIGSTVVVSRGTDHVGLVKSAMLTNDGVKFYVVLADCAAWFPLDDVEPFA